MGRNAAGRRGCFRCVSAKDGGRTLSPTAATAPSAPSDRSAIHRFKPPAAVYTDPVSGIRPVSPTALPHFSRWRATVDDLGFQCSPLSRRSCNRIAGRRRWCRRLISVLTPEPKVVQSDVGGQERFPARCISVLTPEPKVVQYCSGRGTQHPCCRHFSAHP